MGVATKSLGTVAGRWASTVTVDGAAVANSSVTDSVVAVTSLPQPAASAAMQPSTTLRMFLMQSPW